jgi:hypothetical protein
MSPLVFAQVPIGGACEVLALLSLLTLIFLAVCCYSPSINGADVVDAMNERSNPQKEKAGRLGETTDLPWEPAWVWGYRSLGVCGKGLR